MRGRFPGKFDSSLPLLLRIQGGKGNPYQAATRAKLKEQAYAEAKAKNAEEAARAAAWQAKRPKE